MSSLLDFSIIIPSLNEEKVLPRLLADISSQTHKNFEVFVVDGQSEDRSETIVEKLASDDPRFHLVVDPQRNVSHQRNLGAENSSGEYLLFLDADSRITPDFLQKLKYQLNKHPTDAFTCYATADTNDRAATAFITLQNLTHDFSVLVGSPYAIGACFGCKKEVFTKTGGFDPKIKHMEDSEFVKRLSKLKFRYRVFKKPTFVFSLRRQRQEGTLNLIMKLFPYYVHNLITNEYKTPDNVYPMEGGKTFTKLKKKRKLL